MQKIGFPYPCCHTDFLFHVLTYKIHYLIQHIITVIPFNMQVGTYPNMLRNNKAESLGITSYICGHIYNECLSRKGDWCAVSSEGGRARSWRGQKLLKMRQDCLVLRTPSWIVNWKLKPFFYSNNLEFLIPTCITWIGLHIYSLSIYSNQLFINSIFLKLFANLNFSDKCALYAVFFPKH